MEEMSRALVKYGSEACWRWKGRSKHADYSTITVEGKTKGVHRYAFEVFLGTKLPSYIYVCHHCDVKSCFNPKHLFLGTVQDNIQDYHKKGLARVKLTPDKVRLVRQRVKEGATALQLAEEFDITYGYAWVLINRPDKHHKYVK